MGCAQCGKSDGCECAERARLHRLFSVYRERQESATGLTASTGLAAARPESVPTWPAGDPPARLSVPRPDAREGSGPHDLGGWSSLQAPSPFGGGVAVADAAPWQAVTPGMGSPKPAAPISWAPSGGYPPPQHRRVEAAPDDRGMSLAAQRCGIATLVLPVLAIPALVLGFVWWIKCLFRPYLGGGGRAVRGIVAAIFLAPVSVAAYGSFWVHQAPSITTFGSGSEIAAMPLVSPGPGFVEVPTPPQAASALSGSAPQPSVPFGYDAAFPTVRTVFVTNQTRSATWKNGSGEELATIVALAPSPSLGHQLYQDALSVPPGSTTFEVPGLALSQGIAVASSSPGASPVQVVFSERGSVMIAVVDAWSGHAAQAQVDVGRQAANQLNAVPASLARLDKTGSFSEHRHNLVRRAWVDVLTILLLGAGSATVLLAVATLFIVGAQKALRRKGSPAPGWYPDPSGEGDYRVWTGRGWSSRVSRAGRLFKRPLAAPSA